MSDSKIFDFFDIENDRVVISPNVLLVPEFRRLTDKYKDAIPALTYVRQMTHPSSPYRNCPESDKSELIARDIQGEYSLDDPELILAVSKAEEFYLSPTRRFYFDAKVGLERMGKYLRTTNIFSGREGNDTTYLSFLKSVGKITSEFKVLEKEYQEEVSLLRGGQESSYDEES